MRDIEGPESDDLVLYAGWTFIEEPLHVALMGEDSRALALAWIAGTTRGLNLTYATAHMSKQNGFATLAAALALISYSEQKKTKPDISVHAQYEQANSASARVAARLGLLSSPALNFTINACGQSRIFAGSEAPLSAVLTTAKSIVTANVQKINSNIA